MLGPGLANATVQVISRALWGQPGARGHLHWFFPPHPASLTAWLSRALPQGTILTGMTISVSASETLPLQDL